MKARNENTGSGSYFSWKVYIFSGLKWCNTFLHLLENLQLKVIWSLYYFLDFLHAATREVLLNLVVQYFSTTIPICTYRCVYNYFSQLEGKLGRKWIGLKWLHFWGVCFPNIFVCSAFPIATKPKSLKDKTEKKTLKVHCSGWKTLFNLNGRHCCITVFSLNYNI